jgi:hypothetical protein
MLRRCFSVVLLVAVAVAILAGSASAAVLFRDDFNGPSGSPPNPAVWLDPDITQCGHLVVGTTCPPSQARLDGRGHLELVVTRKRGAFISNFQYGTGWPPCCVLQSWPSPLRISIRARLPAARGVWAGLWVMNVDRPVSQPIYELDVMEERSSNPLLAGCYQHSYQKVNGQVINPPVGGGVPGVDVRRWHTYSVQMLPGTTVYRVDGVPCLKAPPVSGAFGMQLSALAGKAGTWQTNTGPAIPRHKKARVKIAWVKVEQ